MTEWEQIAKDLDGVAPFTIDMVADSTVEVWADIDTKLDKDEGWEITGMLYTFENIDPTVPTHTTVAANTVQAIQLHRGNENETLLPAFHPDCIAHYSISTLLLANGIIMDDPWPRAVPVHALTRHQKLRVLFRTGVDAPYISNPNVQLTGIVLYRLISAPDDGRTKLGIPLDEI